VVNGEIVKEHEPEVAGLEAAKQKLGAHLMFVLSACEQLEQELQQSQRAFHARLSDGVYFLSCCSWVKNSTRAAWCTLIAGSICLHEPWERSLWLLGSQATFPRLMQTYAACNQRAPRSPGRVLLLAHWTGEM
jgi:hypothetical protein